MIKRFLDLPQFWQLSLPLVLLVVLGLVSATVGLLGLRQSAQLLENLYQGNVQRVLALGRLDKRYTLHHLYFF